MVTRVLSFQQFQPLSILQLMSSDKDTLEYISGSRAMESGGLEIKEVGEQGSVNELFLLNASKQHVFLMDGDILAGAKQNRVVNTSMLLEPGVKTHIPVGCVERGRWRFVSDKFSSTDYSAPHFMRRSKSESVSENLRAQKGHQSDQGQVWDSVDNAQNVRKVMSQTDNLSDVCESRRIDLEKLVSSFRLDESANRLVVFLGKDLLGTDIFNRADVYAEYFPRILRSLAIEVEGAQRRGRMIPEAEAHYRAGEFLDSISKAPSESYPGIGVGTEHRFAFDHTTGLSLEFKNLLVHMTAIRKLDPKTSQMP